MHSCDAAVVNAGACSTLSRGRNRHDLQPDIIHGRNRRRATRGTMSRSPYAGRACIVLYIICNNNNNMKLDGFVFMGVYGRRFHRGEIRRAVRFFAPKLRRPVVRVLQYILIVCACTCVSVGSENIYRLSRVSSPSGVDDVKVPPPAGFLLYAADSGYTTTG